MELATRLRQLDVEVEQLRAALVELQRRLAQQPPVADGAWVRPDPDEYLRAYV